MKTLTTYKLETISVIFASVFIVVGFFFVRSALNSDEVQILERQETKKGFEVKPATVNLQIENLSARTINIRKRMKNTDSVLELIEAAREDDGITYERLSYTYGTEIDRINGIDPSKGYRWSTFMITKDSSTEEDITFEIGNVNLTDESTYIIRMTKIES